MWLNGSNPFMRETRGSHELGLSRLIGVREIQFTMPLSVSTNGYGGQLDAWDFLSFRAGSRIGS